MAQWLSACFDFSYRAPHPLPIIINQFSPKLGPCSCLQSWGNPNYTSICPYAPCMEYLSTSKSHSFVDKYTIHRASGICPYVCSYQTTMLIPFLWRNLSHDLGRPRSQRRAAKSFGRGLQWRLLEPGNIRDGRDSDAKIGKHVRKTVGFNNQINPKVFTVIQSGVELV